MKSSIQLESDSILEKDIPVVMVSDAEIEELERIKAEGMCSEAEKREILEMLGFQE